MRVKHKNRTQSIKEFRNNLKSQPNWIKIAGIIFISSVFVDDIYLRFNIITTVANEIMQQAAYVGISSEFGMVKIRSGDYSIGLDGALSDEQPSLKQHIKSFYLGKHEVTQKEWSKVMGSNPSSSSICDNCPVGNISFDDAQQFIDKLNRLAKENFRIPTEAEWEYACRGGNMAYKYCGSNNPMDVAWYSKNSNDKSHPIEEKLPNGFGLYDMSGNMWEWTCSSYTSKYDGSEKTCDSSQHEHTVRGGGWLNDQEYIRSANRDGISTNKTNPMTGFRLAKD
jgi:formylglycine-generating enzyme required for sulfatase activity